MPQENVNNCIVCHSVDITLHLECRDHFISNEVFEVKRCNNCGFCFTSPRPYENSIAPYYDSDEYISHSRTETGIANRLFHLSRLYTIAGKKSLVKKYSSGKNILDYGCGTGEFLMSMRKAGWSCTGIEPNTKAREFASSDAEISIHDEASLAELPNGAFQAITLWHVMEHIYPLEERMKAIRALLDEKGTLFVALPNMLSFDAVKYGAEWAAWDVPRHIYHFNPVTIKKLMTNFGFELEKIKPMLLDAFYISLLSEKYKNRKTRLIPAFFTGMRSNVRAFIKDGNYSSLIYIFKKS